MGGIPALTEFTKEQLINDCNELLATFGLYMIVDFDALVTRGSFWERLRDEVAARPRVF